MRVRWTAPAANDLYKIVQRIQKDDPTAAADVAEAIYDACGTLARFPRRGRAGRIEGTRESVSPVSRTSLSIESGLKLLRSYASTTEPRTGRKPDFPSRHPILSS
ncbi:MAG: type II toxin-antitoxin system RelE/ParE family toxin [Candidatus Sulfotelmatobacter sp.]